jgi:hypothetical protein
LFSMNAKLSIEMTADQTLPDMIATYRQLRSHVGDLRDVWLQTTDELIAQKGWPALQLEGVAKLNRAVREIDDGIRKLVGWAHPDQLEFIEHIQSETYDPTVGQSHEAGKLYWEQVEAAMAAMPQPESVPCQGECGSDGSGRTPTRGRSNANILSGESSLFDRAGADDQSGLKRLRSGNNRPKQNSERIQGVLEANPNIGIDQGPRAATAPV